MPLYQQIIVALPNATPAALTETFRRYAKLVLSKGGVLRGIENHGTRYLPERAKRKFISSEGGRYFWDARYVSTVMDVSTTNLADIDRLLKNDANIIRYYTVRVPGSHERVRGLNYKNQYLNAPEAAQKK